VFHILSANQKRVNIFCSLSSLLIRVFVAEGGKRTSEMRRKQGRVRGEGGRLHLGSEEVGADTRGVGVGRRPRRGLMSYSYTPP